MMRLLQIAVLGSLYTNAMAETLESQMNNLQSRVQTVEQRNAAALRDIRDNVIVRYRDSIKIDSITTDVAEVYERTAKISIRLYWHVEGADMDEIESVLSKYFATSTGIDKEALFARVDQCNHNEFCAINKSLSKYMKGTAVGIDASFLGDWQPSILMDGWGTFPKGGSMTYSFTVAKKKIKGDPKPIVKAQIYDVIPCDPSTGCTAKKYDRRKVSK